MTLSTHALMRLHQRVVPVLHPELIGHPITGKTVDAIVEEFLAGCDAVYSDRSALKCYRNRTAGLFAEINERQDIIITFTPIGRKSEIRNPKSDI